MLNFIPFGGSCQVSVSQRVSGRAFVRAVTPVSGALSQRLLQNAGKNRKIQPRTNGGAAMGFFKSKKGSIISDAKSRWQENMKGVRSSTGTDGDDANSGEGEESVNR